MSLKPSLLHDIKSPLTAAKLGLSLLRAELDEKFSSELEDEKVKEIFSVLSSIESRINQTVDLLQTNRSLFEE